MSSKSDTFLPTGVGMGENTLYYGDNLDVLQRYIDDDSIDLIYLDPPFKSNQDYNVLFAEQDGSRSAAQIKVFEDTWRWDQSAAMAFREVVEAGGKVSQVMQSFHLFLGESDMLAYLAMMAPRLVKLRHVLKETGSIYLHCDSTVSHYLKLLMDAVFAPTNFRNEVVWKRADPKGHAFNRYPSTHDVLLYYVKSQEYTWHTQYADYDPDYLKSHYASSDPETGRRFTLSDCTNPNKNRPNLTYEWQGVVKVWRWTKERMQRMHDEGRLVYTKSGSPRYKRYLDEMAGVVVTTVWDDIPFVNSQAIERQGYPTQKPEALLERIIQASSNEGDTILDPFCGCGTAIVAAQKLNRQWKGIDVTYLATSLIKSRLKYSFGDTIEKTYAVIGEPISLPDAAALALQNRFDFQCWALGLVGARPAAGEQKKGADKGIDGRLYFHDDHKTGPTKQVIFSVKSGHLKPDDIRALHGVIDGEKAQIGTLITLQEPTRFMRIDAAKAGFYDSPWGTRHPRLQILTIEELLDGKGIDRPPHEGNVTFKRAPKVTMKKEQQGKLF